MNDSVLFCIILFFLSAQQQCLEANVRFICPRPTSPRSNIESVSCDSDALSESDVVTSLHPGLFSVSFEETRFQPDSPFRITLVDNLSRHAHNETNSTTPATVEDQRSSCLLLDHIPHNNMAIVSHECYQHGNDYPLGVCNGSTYHISVLVPDVTCEDCLLMLQQVVPAQEHEVCEVNQHNKSSPNSCTVYTSCARVTIRSTDKKASRNLDHCSSYLNNLPGDWPYRPQDVYKTEENAFLFLDLLHKHLQIEIPAGLKLGALERVEIHQGLKKIWNTQLTPKNTIDTSGTIQVFWDNMNETDLDALADEQLVLNIVGSQKSLASDIAYSSQHFGEGKLSALHDDYSESGWLTSPKFLGPQAEDPAAAIPWGRCVTGARFYNAFLQSVDASAHGLIGMTVLDHRAFVTAVLHVDRETIQVIRIMGPDLLALPTLEINISQTFNGVLQAAFDIQDALPLMESGAFWKTVEIQTDKEDAVLIGDLEEGIYTVLRDENGKIQGMGAIQLTHGQWLRVDAVWNQPLASLKSAWLSAAGSNLVDLRSQTIHCTLAFCCLQGMVFEVTSELLLHLMKGQLALYLTTAKSAVSGQIIGSPLQYCRIVNGICDGSHLHFSLNGLGVDKVTVPYNNSSRLDVMQTFVLDRTNVLHYCVQIDNLNIAVGRQLTAGLFKANRPIDSILFKPLDELNRNFLACNHIPLEEDHPFIDSLARKSDQGLHVVIKEGSQLLASQELPLVLRGQCFINNVVHEVGKDKELWSAGSAPLQDIYAVVTDQLRFSFGTNTSLFILASKEALVACNFKSATELTALSAGEHSRDFYYTLNQIGSFYFADMETCNTSNPLKLIVHVIDRANQMWDKVHEDLCGKSLFATWHDMELTKWHGPEVTGPVVIGVVVGLTTAGLFLIWQGVRARYIPDRLRSTSENVFVRF